MTRRFLVFSGRASEQGFKRLSLVAFYIWTLGKVSDRVHKADIAVKGRQDGKHRLSIAHTGILEGFSFLVRQTIEV